MTLWTVIILITLTWARKAVEKDLDLLRVEPFRFPIVFDRAATVLLHDISREMKGIKDIMHQEDIKLQQVEKDKSGVEYELFMNGNVHNVSRFSHAIKN